MYFKAREIPREINSLKLCPYSHTGFGGHWMRIQAYFQSSSYTVFGATKFLEVFDNDIRKDDNDVGNDHGS